MSRRKRTQFFVDRKVQGALVLRAALYWLYSLMAVALMLMCWMIVVKRPESSGRLWAELTSFYFPAAAASLVLLPLVLMDLVRLTNRFAGPLFRLRRAMAELAEGRPVQPIHFRQGDFWAEFAESFNRVAARMGQQRDPS